MSLCARQAALQTARPGSRGHSFQRAAEFGHGFAQERANLGIQDQVRINVMLGFFAINDDIFGAILLGDDRNIRRRIDDQRRANRDHQITGRCLTFGKHHFVLRHGLAE